MTMNRRSALGVLAAASVMPLGAVSSATPILTRAIPASGETLPVIGLGTWQTFDVGADATARAPLADVLREFVALGGRMIDSSPMYGRSEEVAGDLIAQQAARDKLFVATKVWISGKTAGITQMQDSMAKLRARPIDLMQVHNLLDVETHLQTLTEWKRAGRVRYVGVTHYTPSAYAEVAKVITAHKPDFLQINYSVGEREAEQRLLPLARERGLAVIINRPFAGGELLRRLRGVPLPLWAGEIGCTSWAQLLLKFVISHPAATCVIPATSKVEHLRDNMSAGVGVLPDAKMRLRIVESLT